MKTTPQETPRPELDVEYEPSLAEEGQEAAGEQRKDPKIKTYRFVTPLRSRDNEVLKAIVDIYLRLRSAGMRVQQIHSDNAGEFTSAPLNHWCTQRAILQTYASGDQRQQSGQAEQTIAELKSRIRRMLHSAGAGSDRWPLAARYLSETLWKTGEKKKCPSTLFV